MIGYFKCGKCGWQKAVEARNFNVPGCPDCGAGVDVSIGGSAPDWYTGPAPKPQKTFSTARRSWWQFWR